MNNFVPDKRYTMKRILFVYLFLGGLLLHEAGNACTSVIVSGKATPDGRPLMWKHRDTGTRYNHITFEKGEKYNFLGLANSDSTDYDIWTGVNEAGFAIMNTASFNLKDDDVQEMDHEGRLMRRALEICKNQQDFEHFLDTLSRPMRVEANFGIIDAYGGAAYYETNNTRYYKKDVNDPNLAPDGYLVYTNFSFEGRKDEGYGYIRYESAKKIFADIYPQGLTPRSIFQEVSHSFYHSLFRKDMKEEKNTEWQLEQDLIPRFESTASIVIQGVKKGMNPELTTMWTELGYPPTAIALPLWVKLGEKQPELVLYSLQFKTAPLCYFATLLKTQAYPIHRGNGQKYIHWSELWNAQETGYIQTLMPVWNEIYDLFARHQAEWEQKGLDVETINRLYQEAEEKIKPAYYRLMRVD